MTPPRRHRHEEPEPEEQMAPEPEPTPVAALMPLSEAATIFRQVAQQDRARARLGDAIEVALTAEHRTGIATRAVEEAGAELARRQGAIAALDREMLDRRGSKDALEQELKLLRDEQASLRQEIARDRAAAAKESRDRETSTRAVIEGLQAETRAANEELAAAKRRLAEFHASLQGASAE